MRETRESWARYAVVAVCVLAALLTGCTKPEKAKQKYLESGERHYDKGEYREAVIQYQNAIQIDSRFAEAHFRMAQAAVKLQQWPGALQEFQTAIQLNPDYAEARLELAKLLIAGRQYPAAKEQLDLLTQKQPNNPEVYLALATYHDGIKDAAAAMKDVQDALKKDPNRSDSYLSLGILDAQVQQWEEAEKNFKKAVELSPKSVDALIALGNLYQTRGRYPEAEDTFRRAIEAAPNDPAPRLSLSGLFLAENKAGAAEEFLRQSKNDFRDNSAGYNMLGMFYLQTGQYDKALAEYASLYDDHPGDPIVRKNYIQLLIERNRLDDARKVNDKILKAEPGDIDAQIARGDIDVHSGKASDAVDALSNVLKNDPNNALAHYELGLAFDQLGNASRAEGEWREAVRLRPDIVEVHRALAGSAIHRGDVSQLAQEADQIVALQPGNPDGYLLRGVAEIDRRQYAVAEQYIRQSIEKEANNPAAYVQLGNLKTAQGQFEEALRAYQHALELDPNSSDALGGVLNASIAQGQPDKGLAALKAQLAKYPNNYAFHIMLGDWLDLQAKDLAGAEAQYRRAEELDKGNSAALVKVGMVQQQRGAADAALQTYMECIKVNPKDLTCYFQAGSLYDEKKDWERAKAMYQKVLAIDPDNPLASNGLAYVMLEQGGNVDLAFQMAQTARRTLPGNPNTADTLGWAFYQKHVYASAIGLFQEAVRKEPDKLEFNYHLGMAYAKNGQAALARQQLERVVKIKPNSAEAEDLRRAVAEAKRQG